MDTLRQRQQVDLNYDAFTRMLNRLLVDHRDELALMRDGEVIGFYQRPGDAYQTGISLYPDEIFSIQEVTDEPIDLGFWSYVGN